MQPAVSHTELFSYLVTRHTGRTVRASIERELERLDRAVLAVLDMRNVPLIDFSCADEVVAKLVVLSAAARPHPRYVLFRGVAEHHREPIESALGRQGLAAAAESVDGEPLLLGAMEPDHAAAWREVWALGRTAVPALADRLALRRGAVARVLEDLAARALVIRHEEVYLSLGRALHEAQGDEPPA